MTAPSPRLTLLGGFELRSDGEHVALSTSAQRLLAFVALRERPLQRSYVAGSLWLDSAEERAAANLRSALWRLHGCGIQLVHCMGPQLSLDPDLVVDLREAEQLAHRVLDRTNGGDLDVDASLLSGDLLPDWYDDWVLTEAEDWRQLRLHALEALAGHLTTAGRWGEAAGAARAAVRAEPLRESGHAALIQVHLAEGNQSEAVGEFARYRTLLRAELGLEPTSRLHELVRDLRSATPA